MITIDTGNKHDIVPRCCRTRGRLLERIKKNIYFCHSCKRLTKSYSIKNNRMKSRKKLWRV